MLARKEKRLTVCKRLLVVNGRFARDVEHLLTVQYVVESKQVAGDASIVLQQTQHRGQALTAAAVAIRIHSLLNK